ncbi:MAG: substrate-binding domain-containing protein [Armatimonadetes bacterium]|nr:substrate-binding domain-containing protein [Armatimonadota bacterium]
MKSRSARIMAVAMIAALAFCMTSCGKKQPGAGGKTYRVGVTLLTKSHPFYQQLESAMQEVADRENVKLNIQSAEFDMKDQQAQIENFITQQVDALVVCPVDSDTIGGAIRQANKAGIPVFTADISANGGDVVCHIASDNVAGGRLAGEYMAKLLKGKGKIIIIDHPKVMSVRDRTKGFVDAISKFPGIKIVARPPGDGERGKSMDVMETMLQSHPDINGVFAINDSTALGALAALRQAKREDIVIVGYDGDPEAKAEILKGSPLKADSVQYPRKIGATTIEMLVKHLKGEKVPAKVPVEVGIIDKASLEEK